MGKSGKAGDSILTEGRRNVIPHEIRKTFVKSKGE
jgi:hypothetical protein